MEALQAAFANLACTVERYIAQHSCSWCGGPFNGGNYPGCSSVRSRNEFVYDPNPYSYNATPNFFNQPRQHQYETYSCELCGDSSHYGFDCQTRTLLVYEQVPRLHDSSNCQSRNPVFYESNSYNNFDSSGFDQPSQYPIIHLPLHEMSLHELSMMMNLGTPTPEPLVNSSVYEESDEDIEATHAYTPSLPFLTTMEPADTLLMGDEVISTTLARENDKLIKYSVDDLVPIPKESEVTSNSNLECDMHVNAPLPTTDVREENFYINSPLGEYVVDFLVENKDIADLPKHLVKQLFSYLVKHLSSTKRMSDEPLGNPDSVSRSLETCDLNLEELTAEIGLDDSILTEFVDGYYNSKGGILFLDHLLIEETFFDPTPTVLPKNSTLLVTPPLASNQFILKEVERFDVFSP
nr:hypothetical protein [Tanacetum cinerariifolium]